MGTASPRSFGLLVFCFFIKISTVLEKGIEMDNYFTIGKIVNTQGIKGEVRVMPQTDDITRFELLKSVFVVVRGKTEELEITSVRYHKQFVLLKFKGVDDMTTAEKYKTALLKIPEELAMECEEDEYYIRDLYDMEVVTDEGEELGIISDIIFGAANDVYVVKNSENEILIPAIKQCILNVDVAGNKMTVHLLEGLR